jgi:hypothetical protein
LSVEEQEALAESLIFSLGGRIDSRRPSRLGREIAKRLAELDSGKVKTIPYAEVRRRNLAKLPNGH